MKYSFIKNSLSTYYWASTPNFFRSFNLSCYPQLSIINKLATLLDNKNLNSDISPKDLAKLADKLAEKISDDPTLRTNKHSPYAKLLITLIENLFTHAVIDLCIQEQETRGTTITASILEGICTRADNACKTYESTYKIFQEKLEALYIDQTLPKSKQQKYAKILQPSEISKRIDYVSHYQFLRDMCDDVNQDIEKLNKKAHFAEGRHKGAKMGKIDLTALDTVIKDLPSQTPIESFDVSKLYNARLLD